MAERGRAPGRTQGYVGTWPPRTAVPAGGFATLRTSQLDCGAWPYQPGGGDDIGATIGAILGILRQPLPVPPLSATRPVPSMPPCA